MGCTILLLWRLNGAQFVQLRVTVCSPWLSSKLMSVPLTFTLELMSPSPSDVSLVYARGRGLCLSCVEGVHLVFSRMYRSSSWHLFSSIVASGPGEIGPDDCASLYHTLLIFFNGVVGDLLDLRVCGPDLMIMSCQLAGLLIMITMRLSFSGFVTSTLVIFCGSTPHLILIKLSKVLVEELCPDRVHDPGHPGFQMAFLLLILSCMVSIQ